MVNANAICSLKDSIEDFARKADVKQVNIILRFNSGEYLDINMLDLKSKTAEKEADPADADMAAGEPESAA